MSHYDDERRELERAPFLFSELPLEVQSRMFKREQDRHDWTAARLFSENRKIYDVIVRMLGVGIHVRLVGELCGVTDKTVAAVRDAEPVAVTAFREKMGVRRRGMISRLADNMAAALEKEDMETGAKIAKDLAVAWNILDGQERLDAGAPTAIVEHQEPAALEKFREFMAGVLDVKAETERVPQTGSGGGERGTKSAADPAPGDGSSLEDKR